ncbi:hypothetical protein HYO65_gp076 [Tenacibaculum phage PTm1]|uniref:Uncharacterized protein n=2 Tax=Shirahamavirus PTm1 TaxID=2846435 RepID=A0A5S9BZ13_9CAUD|nr:hypothetical protein HYO65_gp076 [Tenacibaculum phage PTm1]BBI90468.1 hypothetical protein [Tenacibaculum phage PTm1]BBI90775.1 hypothetical protein [Tenacibaculum phage PTm5]
MKLSYIINLGRYENKETGKAYNIKKGKNKLRGTDHIFYLYRGSRIFINDSDFYTNYKKLN